MEEPAKEALATITKDNLEKSQYFIQKDYKNEILLLEALHDINYKFDYKSLQPDLENNLLLASKQVLRRKTIHASNFFPALFNIRISPERKYDLNIPKIKKQEIPPALPVKPFSLEEEKRPKTNKPEIQNVLKLTYDFIENDLDKSVKNLAGIREILHAKRIETVYKEYIHQSHDCMIKTSSVSSEIYINAIKGLSEKSLASDSKKIMSIGFAFLKDIDKTLKKDIEDEIPQKPEKQVLDLMKETMQLFQSSLPSQKKNKQIKPD
jgi:hypothetical protein